MMRPGEWLRLWRDPKQRTPVALALGILAVALAWAALRVGAMSGARRAAEESFLRVLELRGREREARKLLSEWLRVGERERREVEKGIPGREPSAIMQDLSARASSRGVEISRMVPLEGEGDAHWTSCRVTVDFRARYREWCRFLTEIGSGSGLLKLESLDVTWNEGEGRLDGKATFAFFWEVGR